jgi:phosphoribosylglycinamide formyltransferase 1
MRLRVVVVVSGKGSNLAALLGALGQESPAQVVLVMSDRAEAGGLDLARRAGIPTHVFNDISNAGEWRNALAEAAAGLVVLAGFLKKVPEPVVRDWSGRIINIHPALLPRHGGPGMYGRRVHQAVLNSGDAESGATVHLVTEEYDQGPVLGQASVPVLPGDTAEALAARVLEVEHRLLPAAVLAAARAGKPVAFEWNEGSRVESLTPDP